MTAIARPQTTTWHDDELAFPPIRRPKPPRVLGDSAGAPPLRAGAQIAALRAKIEALKQEVAHLKVQLRGSGSELPDLPPDDIRSVFMAKLPPKAAALMGALLAAYPRTLDRCYLDEVMPARDHTKERDLRTIDVQVVKARKVLGPDAVETVWGRGFRLGPALVKYLSPDRRLKTELDQYAD